MMSTYFEPSHADFRQRVRSLLAREVLPHADNWEAQRKLPRETWQALGGAGLLGLHYPSSVGGTGRDIFHSVILLEELGRTGYAGFGIAVAVHAYMATSYLALVGTPAQQKNYLSPAIAGTKVAALALTEPQAGSDLGQLSTSATLDGEDYILRGTKKFVANGTTADYYVVAARTGPMPSSKQASPAGVSLLLVDANVSGLVKRPLSLMGWHASDTAEIELNNVRVPATHVIGRVGSGFMYVVKCLQLERLAAGLLAIGRTEHCLTVTRKRLFGRRISGQELGRFQAIRHGAADLLTQLEATRHLAYHAVWKYAHAREQPIAECSMVKLAATELCLRTAQECMRWHGAAGYEQSSDISRAGRDSHAATVAGGASEVMRDTIALTTLDDAARWH